MNRLLALGVVGWVAFGALGACQGPDPFDRLGDAGIHGLGGHGPTGVGGMRGVGGFIAVGVGGHGVGGTIGGVGGTGVGGHGVGGAIGTGGMASDGGIGTGGRGVGGHIGDAGANCITTIINNGYAATGAAPCSACMDQNHLSFESGCTMTLDCMAQQPQPCIGNCETDCLNFSGQNNGPLQTGCVDALLSAGCP